MGHGQARRRERATERQRELRGIVLEYRSRYARADLRWPGSEREKENDQSAWRIHSDYG